MQLALQGDNKAIIARFSVKPQCGAVIKDRMIRWGYVGGKLLHWRWPEGGEIASCNLSEF